jgi:PAS domain-containing protein
MSSKNHSKKRITRRERARYWQSACFLGTEDPAAEYVRQKLTGHRGYGPHVFEDAEVEIILKELKRINRSLQERAHRIDLGGMSEETAQLVLGVVKHLDSDTFTRSPQQRDNRWDRVGDLAKDVSGYRARAHVTLGAELYGLPPVLIRKIHELIRDYLENQERRLQARSEALPKSALTTTPRNDSAHPSGHIVYTDNVPERGSPISPEETISRARIEDELEPIDEPVEAGVVRRILHRVIRAQSKRNPRRRPVQTERILDAFTDNESGIVLLGEIAEHFSSTKEPRKRATNAMRLLGRELENIDAEVEIETVRISG